MQFILDTIYFVVFHLTQAVMQPWRSDSFLYWPFLISALLLALAVWYFRLNRQSLSWSEFRGRHLGRGIWAHPSALADYRFFFANALMMPALFGSLMTSPAAVAQWLDSVLGFAGPGHSQSSTYWQLAFTIVFFVAYDFGRYAAHAAQHFVPALWAFHAVHHSAQVLTPLTAYRVHPVDLWIMTCGSTLATGIATWGFNWLAGGPVDYLLFMGMHALLWLSNLTGNLNHSSVWLSFGPRWGLWLISPAHHQIHHSTSPEHLDRNMGFTLAIWDRLFRTLYVPSVEPEAFMLGLSDGTSSRWNTVRYMMLAPITNTGRRLWSALSIKGADLR